MASIEKARIKYEGFVAGQTEMLMGKYTMLDQLVDMVVQRTPATRDGRCSFLRTGLLFPVSLLFPFLLAYNLFFFLRYNVTYNL